MGGQGAFGEASAAAATAAAAGSATAAGGAAAAAASAAAGGRIPPGVEAELGWAAATLTDLTPATAVLIIAADGTPLVAAGAVDPTAVAAGTTPAGGPVVARVAAERRGVYVADGAALPVGVDLPFGGAAGGGGGGASWAADVLYLPRSGAVAAVGAPVVRGAGGGGGVRVARVRQRRRRRRQPFRLGTACGRRRWRRGWMRC